jgi:hypothetical protein
VRDTKSHVGAAIGPVLARRALLSVLGVAIVLSGSAARAETAPSTGGIDIGYPPPGKALIVFFRDSDLLGAAISYMVREGPTEIGRLGNGRYFVAVVEPGLHTYSVSSEARIKMQIRVDADEIYYVRYDLESGYFYARRPALTPSEPWRFLTIASTLKRSEPARQEPPKAESDQNAH